MFVWVYKFKRKFCAISYNVYELMIRFLINEGVVMQSNTERYKNIIMQIIRKHLPSVKVMLYGSRARGDFSEGSDIDIALDAGKKIDTKIMNTIIDDIDESVIPINFDIVDFHKVSEKMRQEILKDGIVWP